MKLAAFRDKDRTHLRDLIEVGLIDATWLSRLEPGLRERLQLLVGFAGGLTRYTLQQLVMARLRRQT
jgi:hypothetical protein